MNVHCPGSWRIIAALGVFAVAAALAIPVSRDRVQIRSEQSLLSPVVTSAKRGDDLEILSRLENGWLRVRVGKQEGFVRESALADPQRPADVASLAQSGGSTQLEAATATKGLDKDALAYAGARHYNTAPLQRMIDVRQSISDADLQRFKSQASR
jgi:Bacterial SH3 domain